MQIRSSSQPKGFDSSNRKFLMVDRAFIERSHGVRLRIHPPLKTGERLLESDRPWEDATLNWFSVLKVGRRYRMWYEAYDRAGWPTPDDTSFCLAESTDGIRWSKPNVGSTPYANVTKTNILFRRIGGPGHLSRVHGANVFLDPEAPRNERYKCVSQGIFESEGTPPYRIAGMVSEDGILWRRIPRPICPGFADSQYSGFRDPWSGKIQLFGRVAAPTGRAIGRSESDSFDRFPELNRVLERRDEGPFDSDLYNPACTPYPESDDGLYWMFPSLFRHGPDTLDIQLAVSRDGTNWTWPDPETPFIALGPPGSFDSGSLYMGNGGCLPTRDGWSFYYSGSPLRHGEVAPDKLAVATNRRVISRATSIPDRLVSITSHPGGGRFTTTLLHAEPSQLRVHATTSSHGSIRVEVADENGTPLTGFRGRDCRPLSGDCRWSRVRWAGNPHIRPPESGRIRLTFELRDANLFGFRLSTNESL